MNTEELVKECTKLLEELKILPNEKVITICFSDMIRFNNDLADELHERYQDFIKCIQIAQEQRQDSDEKFTAEIRFTNIPKSLTINIGGIRKKHLDKFYGFEGTLIRAGDIWVTKSLIKFSCPSCGNIITIIQLTDRIISPKKCPCGRVGNFREISATWKNVQFIIVEEYITDYTNKKARPSIIKVRLEEGLTDENLNKKIEAGRHVKFSGLIVPKQIRDTAFFNQEILCNNIQIEDFSFFSMKVSKKYIKQFKELKNNPNLLSDLSGSLFYDVEGLETVKDILFISRARGVKSFKQNGKLNKRDTINVFIISDPGNSKSVLGKLTVEIDPIHIAVSGKGISGCGLTATAINDKELGWGIEAGALPRTNKGSCISGEQLIITNHGVKKFKDLNLFDKIISYDNKFTFKDIIALKYNGKKEVIKLNFFNGDSLECTKDHKILTENGYIEAGQVEKGDFCIYPSKNLEIENIKEYDKSEFELGYLMGFGISDIYIPSEDTITKKRNRKYINIRSSVKNKVRFNYVVDLIKKYYNPKTIKIKEVKGTKTILKNKPVQFSDSFEFSCSSAQFHKDLDELFNLDCTSILFNSFSKKVGFICGLLDTDASISKKKGKTGYYKWDITITLGRRRTNWRLINKYKTIQMIFSSLGIFSSIRYTKSSKNAMLSISSIDSINKIFSLCGHLFKRHENFNNLERKVIMPGYDSKVVCDFNKWFKSIKFNTSQTLKYGLHSKIYNIIKEEGRANISWIKEKLLPLWDKITEDDFNEIYSKKNYILNGIISIESLNKEEDVYDIQIKDTPNFLVGGSIVHNCFLDEIDKIDDKDTSAINEAMVNLSFMTAKANQQVTLYADVGIIGAANPEGRKFDSMIDKYRQITLSPDFLDRFDIWIALDKDKSKQKDITRKIIQGFTDYSEQTTKAKYDFYFIRNYLAWIIQTFKPKINLEMEKYATNEINKIMNKTNTETGEKTKDVSFRLVENIIRFSMALAKIYQSNEVKKEHIDKAIYYQMYGLKSLDMIDEHGAISQEKIGFEVPVEVKRKKYNLIDIITELKDKNNKNPTTEEIEKRWDEEGNDKSEVYDMLQKMKVRGEVFEPQSNFWRII